jgi:hypothetical protein
MDAISEICHEKAIHLQDNWQDNKTAKLWDKAGNKISKIDLKEIAY